MSFWTWLVILAVAAAVVGWAVGLNAGAETGSEHEGHGHGGHGGHGGGHH